MPRTESNTEGKKRVSVGEKKGRGAWTWEKRLEILLQRPGETSQERGFRATHRDASWGARKRGKRILRLPVRKERDWGPVKKPGKETEVGKRVFTEDNPKRIGVEKTKGEGGKVYSGVSAPLYAGGGLGVVESQQGGAREVRKIIAEGTPEGEIQGGGTTRRRKLSFDNSRGEQKRKIREKEAQ